MKRTYDVLQNHHTLTENIRKNCASGSNFAQLTMKNTDIIGEYLCLVKVIQLFRSRYKVIVEDRKITFQQKLTLSQIICLVTNILLICLALLVIIGSSISNTDPGSIIMALFVSVILLVCYCVYFYLLPNKIIKEYLHKIDTCSSYPTYEAPDTSMVTNLETSMKMNPNTCWESLKPTNLERSYHIRQTINTAIASILFFVLLFIAKYLERKTSNSSIICYILSGLFFIKFWDILYSNLLLKITVNKVLSYAAPYNGTISKALTSNKETYFVYRFYDEQGTNYERRSFLKATLSKSESPESMIGQRQKIWFAQDKCNYVIAGDSKEIIQKSIVKPITIIPLLILLFGCILSFAYGYHKDHDFDPVGKSLEIEWNAKYVDDGLTQADVDSDTLAWFCNTYALNKVYEAEYGDNNQVAFGVIGMYEPTKENASYVQEYLKQTWGISDRATAISTINDFLEHGSRDRYPGLLKELKKQNWFKEGLSDSDILSKYNDDESLRYLGAYQACQKYPNQGIDAWDYCRMMRVTGLCYVAGYINLSECLDQCLPIAKQLQSEYDSWYDLAYDYIYGFRLWIKDCTYLDASNDYQWCADTLIENAANQSGPYLLDFHTKLTDTWSKARCNN